MRGIERRERERQRERWKMKLRLQLKEIITAEFSLKFK